MTAAAWGVSPDPTEGKGARAGLHDAGREKSGASPQRRGWSVAIAATGSGRPDFQKWTGAGGPVISIISPHSVIEAEDGGSKTPDVLRPTTPRAIAETGLGRAPKAVEEAGVGFEMRHG